MSKPFLRWMLLLLRYGLCVVAIAWLVHTVPWYDYVRLTGPKGPMVRLWSSRAGTNS